MTQAGGGLSRTGKIVMAVLVVAVVYLLFEQVSSRVTANTASEEKQVAEDKATEARQDAKDLGDPVYALCQRDAEVRRRLGALCDKAAEVKDQPLPAAAPRDGKDGRGIATTAIRNGHLLITYTDGDIEDKGVIVGRAGKTGKNGRSITGTAITGGNLVLSYSDGTTETAGRVVGADGRDGRGIASVTINGDFRLLVTYTDGETVDVGPLPSGRDGRGIASVAFDMESCEATVTYTDGAVETSPMSGCDDKPPPDETPPSGGLLPGS